MTEQIPLIVEAAPKIDVTAALKEIKQKSKAKIEAETSYRWAARSIACYQLFEETGLLSWLLRAKDNEHEAKEHGSLVEDENKTLEFVCRAINKAKKRIKIPEKLSENLEG